MGTNKHAQDRVKSGHTTPPSGVGASSMPICLAQAMLCARVPVRLGFSLAGYGM